MKHLMKEHFADDYLNLGFSFKIKFIQVSNIFVVAIETTVIWVVALRWLTPSVTGLRRVFMASSAYWLGSDGRTVKGERQKQLHKMGSQKH